MRPHEPHEARDVVALAERFQRLTRELLGRAKVFASDEFYLVGGSATPGRPRASRAWTRPRTASGWWPPSSRVSPSAAPMAKLGSGFFQSVDGAPALGLPGADAGRSRTATRRRQRHGADRASTRRPSCAALFDEHGFADVEVKAVKNRFFGGNIKVAGLITGQDLQSALDEIDEPTASASCPTSASRRAASSTA